VIAQIGTSADAAKDQAAGLAGADETLSVASPANLAGFTATEPFLTKATALIPAANQGYLMRK